MEICFVTSNDGKLKEARALLGSKLAAVEIDIDEIQALDVRDVVKDKAMRSYAIVNKPIIVEDTGLYIKGLNGFPGALIKWALKTIGNDGLCGMLGRGNRKAYSETAICLYDGKKAEIFVGRTDGSISTSPKGKSSFGWDPIFIPEGGSQTYAEMGSAEKKQDIEQGESLQETEEAPLPCGLNLDDLMNRDKRKLNLLVSHLDKIRGN